MAVSSETIKEIDESREKSDFKKIEAILFVSGRFLNMGDLVALSELNPVVITDLLEQITKKYDKDDSALQIVEKAGMWKMDVCPEFMYLVNRLATGSAEFSKAEQETLAIIAFKQPIKQSVIIRIRGNKAYDHIKKFVDTELVKKKRLGRTYELSLSEEFYDYFNVSEQSLLSKNSEE